MFRLFLLPDGTFALKEDLSRGSGKGTWIGRNLSSEEAVRFLLLYCEVAPPEVMKAFNAIEIDGHNVVEFGYHRRFVTSYTVDYKLC